MNRIAAILLFSCVASLCVLESKLHGVIYYDSKIQISATAGTNYTLNNYVPLFGTNMLGPLTNNFGYYGNNLITNIVVTQSSDYIVLVTDSVVLLSGNHSATLPSAVRVAGKQFTIKCTSTGTNALLTTPAQTIDGATKWTNTANLKYTTVISDGANWRVIGQN